MASQMAPAVFDTTTVDYDLTQAEVAVKTTRAYLFRSTGSVIKFPGFLALYREAREEGEHRALEDEQALPSLEKGERVPVRDITPSQHFTEPPPRFSEASLVKELERLGIGRPSTYAQIISTLVDRHYTQLEQRRFFPTAFGESVERVMVKQFPDIFNVGFTSEMEGELDKVEEGALAWRRVLADFYRPFEKSLNSVQVEILIAEAHDLSGLAAERCPNCGGRLMPKGGFFGPFVACENHPKTCKFTRPLKGDRKPAEPTEYTCHECGVDDAQAARALRVLPGLQPVPEMPRNAVDAYRGDLPEGRRRDRRASVEEAREGVLRVLELSEVRFRVLGQAGGGKMPGMRLPRGGNEVQQDPRRVPEVPQVRQRVGRSDPRSRRSRGRLTGSVVLNRIRTEPPTTIMNLIAAIESRLGPGWSIAGELGTGATSRVYLAIRSTDGERMVVKLMKSGTAAAERSQHFLLEMQILQKMSHPNVVPITDAGEAQGVLFFTMPFVEGETMRQRLRREGAFPVLDAVRFARDVALALGHVHSLGVVHRDVKPDNILLSSNGAILLDFGHARAPSIVQNDGRDSKKYIIGTPNYVSPEQVSGRRAFDSRSDLYSLGCVLLEMLTGRRAVQCVVCPGVDAAAH